MRVQMDKMKKIFKEYLKKCECKIYASHHVSECLYEDVLRNIPTTQMNKPVVMVYSN